MRGLVAGMLRLTERDFVRGLMRLTRLTRRDLTKVVPSIKLGAMRTKGRLTTGQLREVRRLMARLYDLLGNHAGTNRRTMHALTMVIRTAGGTRKQESRRAQESQRTQALDSKTTKRAYHRAQIHTVELKGAGT
jgi:hypothetical protein